MTPAATAAAASDPSLRLVSGAVHLLLRAPESVRGEIRRALRERTILPAHLFYETGGGSANWTELTDDASYASAADSAALFRARSREIGRAVAGLLGDGGQPANVISLGPGSGWKDELVLRALADAKAPGSLRYHALDTSPSLAMEAMTRVLSSDELAGRNVGAQALVARFEDLPALRPWWYASAGAVNLVMLLGNTLGNLADERGLLRLVAGDAMEDGDLLLLEVTLQKPGTDEIASLGARRSIERFNFEPLAAIGVRFAEGHMTYRVTAGRSAIPGTATVVASYRDFAVDGEAVASADIAYVHRYRAAAVLGAVTGAGFAVVGAPWFGPQERSMVVLARRGPVAARIPV